MPISPLGAANLKSDLIFWKPTSDFLLVVKDHRQRIPKKIVIRRYLERSIQKKFFPTYTHYK